MENVPDCSVRSSLNDIQNAPRELGFKLAADRLNAADYGTPQTRKRAVVIAWKIGAISEPELPPPHTGPRARQESVETLEDRP